MNKETINEHFRERKREREAVMRFQERSNNQLSDAMDRVAQRLRKLADRRENTGE